MNFAPAVDRWAERFDNMLIGRHPPRQPRARTSPDTGGRNQPVFCEFRYATDAHG